MNPQIQQRRRSSEVRGCLLGNFLDMRKLSLIRSESQDSGFSLESYDPFVSSFDAEKFLEELGFAGDNAPLIPDRFIPSLIHRISNMPDETVVKLDTRVWNSIDSFKKKENAPWFFRQSSVMCDLCINDFQRSYSVPAEFVHDSYYFSYPGNSACTVEKSSTSESRVQNWLSRFAGNSLTTDDKSKANIAFIGNQSSTESGILSALSDDEAYTAANHNESFNDSCYSPQRVDDFGFLVREVESLEPTYGMDSEESRTSQTMPSSTSSIKAVTMRQKCQHYETRPSENVSLTDAGTYGGSNGEACLSGINTSFLNRADSAEECDHYKSLGKNITGDSSEIPNEFATCNGNLKQGDWNKVPTCGQHFSVTNNLNSDTEGISLAIEACHQANVEVEDADSSICRASLSKNSDASRFDTTKKRHSFDSAYLNAAEKRKRFRLSHSKTHNSLFQKEDSCFSGSHFNDTAADDAMFCDDIHEETEIDRSNQLHPQKGDDGSQDISHCNGCNVDNTPLEVSDIISNIDTSYHNGGTALKVSDAVSNVDVSNHDGDNGGTALKVSDAVSNVDVSNHGGDNAGTPLGVSDSVRNDDISNHNVGNVDTPLKVSDAVSNVDVSNHNGGTVDTQLEMSGVVSNADMSNRNVGNVDTPLKEADAVSNADMPNRNVGNVDTPFKVSDAVSNVDMSNRNVGNVDTPLKVSDAVSNIDISNNKGGNLDIPLEVPGIVSSVEQFKAFECPSISDSESSEQYFSCDELCSTKPSADDNFTEHDGDEKKREIPSTLFPCVPGEQRVAPAKITSQVLSKDKASFGNRNRITYTKYKEHFILNKILKRSLKFSVLCPIEKMSRHFLLENDNENFSQILNSNDPPSSLKSKTFEKHTQSVTYGERASYDTVQNSGVREKPIERIMGDKGRELDNNHSIISKPFVRNQSLTSDMFSPKCEVRLIDYDGMALFWAARNKAANGVSCDLRFTDSTYSKSDNSVNSRFINGVYMDVNSGNETDSPNTKVYFSEVRLEVNSEDAERDPKEERLERSIPVEKFQSEDVKNKAHDGDFSTSKTPANTENPYGRALRDLEDLKIAIRKAKETRMSASRELRLLQELLHHGDSEGDETTRKREAIPMIQSQLSLPDVDIVNGNHGKGETMEALSELQQKSSKEASQNKELWEEEIRKAKEEVSQVYHEKVNIMEEKLRTTEDELARSLKENTRLKDQLELRSTEFPVCKCNAQQHSDFLHMNGISDEDPQIIPVVKPSVSTKNFWQEWDRLQSDLMKAERKADELNILLNRKLIELNRMQLTLSKQTKEMILLEKAYFQLRSHLSKRKLHKTSSSHQSSSATKAERTSEESPKTKDPEIPP